MKIAYACLLALALWWLPTQAQVSGNDLSFPGQMILHTSPAPLDAGVPAIMREGFEGDWPSLGWTLRDGSVSDGGEYLPGKRACNPHSGGYAGWMVGGGSQGSTLACGSVFPSNADTWASYGPFDLTNATRASLDVHLWGRSEMAPECGADYLFLGSSYDGVNYAGMRYCGDWSQGSAGHGYHKQTLDLGHYLGQSRVWVAISFASNATGADVGFIIDDIALNVETSGSARRSYLPLLLKLAAQPAGPTPTPTTRPPAYRLLALYPHGDYSLRPGAQVLEESIAITPASPWREWSYDLTGDIQGQLGADVTLRTYFSSACFRLAFYHSRGTVEVLLAQSNEVCVANETKRFTGTLEGLDPMAQAGDRLLFRISHSSGAYGHVLIGGNTNAHIQLMAQE